MTRSLAQNEADTRPPLSDADYFAIFGLPRLLAIDTAALEREFYRQSRRLHPDLFATASKQEQEQATERSSMLNDAYRTLRQPVERTQYLLRLEGASVEEESEKDRAAAQAAGTPREQKVPPEMLAEVFELNMQLEELQMGGDDPALKAELQSAAAGFDRKLAQCDLELQELWTQWDAALVAGDDASAIAARDAAKQAMLALLNRRNYIRNLVRDVRQALGE